MKAETLPGKSEEVVNQFRDLFDVQKAYFDSDTTKAYE